MTPGPLSPPANEGDPCLVVFTRDLRLHDNPVLTAALESGRPIVPVFVDDDAIVHGRPRRAERDAYLEESLADLDGSLRRLGSALVRRRGNWPAEVLRLADASGAVAVHVLADVSPYARRRLDRLRRMAGRAVQIETGTGITVVPPGAVTPDRSDHYQVFTPYYRQWLAVPWRPMLPPPRRLPSPAWVAQEPPVSPTPTPTRTPARIPTRPAGGERHARRRMQAWIGGGLDGYPQRRDRMDDPGGTSGLSTDLHFGCLSPLELASRARTQTAFVRQLCWRDFYMQAVAARPEVVWENFSTRPWSPRPTPGRLAAWREGRTGYPLVDAAMRQLELEGFVHNRARMVAASFLAKDLELDWRDGARHFLELLVDADVVVNNLNWQWTAGTGTGSHPGRALSPVRQGHRFDPEGSYVRRYLPELRSLAGAHIHEPSPDERSGSGYPPPIVP